MKGDYYIWKKMKNRDIPYVEDMLRDLEEDYVSACGRYLVRDSSKDPVWLLCAGSCAAKSGKKNEIPAIVINSKSTVIPVLCGLNEIPDLNFLNSFLRIKKIHSIQGLKNEVIVMENAIKKFGWKTAEIIDYDLMKLDSLPRKNSFISSPSNLVLQTPGMINLDEIAPLQAAYEQEEVIPNGSVFSPAASRINIANITAKGKILAAQLNGKFVGKINVSSVSFTRYLVGGVYVHPDYRRMGIAHKMAYEFISSLINEGRGVTLFVKKTNDAARRLYLNLGFSIKNDYRITYY